MKQLSTSPWGDCPDIWKDEKAYMSWLRSAARRIWSKSPVKIEYKKSRRYKAPVGKRTKRNPKGMVFVSDCELCGVQSRKCEVDHIEGAGSFTNWNEFTVWLKKLLFVSFEDIRELCHECHGIVSHAQKTGLSFEEAKREKRVIELGKMKADKLKKFLLDKGYDSSRISNQKLRRECLREYVR